MNNPCPLSLASLYCPPSPAAAVCPASVAPPWAGPGVLCPQAEPSTSRAWFRWFAFLGALGLLRRNQCVVSQFLRITSDGRWQNVTCFALMQAWLSVPILAGNGAGLGGREGLWRDDEQVPTGFLMPADGHGDLGDAAVMVSDVLPGCPSAFPSPCDHSHQGWGLDICVLGTLSSV